MDERIRLAPYLGGTLWHLRATDWTFVLFNSLPIAKREINEEAWTVIAPNWKVVKAGFRKVRVQYAGSPGIVVSMT
jgi:hypothetical protein